MILFGIVIRRAKSIRGVLDLAVQEQRNNGAKFNHLVAIYNCRIFGVCIYRASNKWINWTVKKSPEFPLTEASFCEYGNKAEFVTKEYTAIRPAIEYAILNGANLCTMLKAKEALESIKSPIAFTE